MRRIGVELRLSLTQRLQQLSIGFHTRAGSSRLQNKVVRDVENVELMLQQVSEAGTAAVITLIGALAMTAIRVPQFVPLFLLVVPCSAVLVAVTLRRGQVHVAEHAARLHPAHLGRDSARRGQALDA